MAAEEQKLQYDPEQERMMDEECILLDREDKPIGHASKRECHLIENALLHRAFSVFLFNSKGELLLQQRATEKITFPDRWTNTCCSHPLYVDSERIEEGALGVKNAAIRKLEHELGIKVGTIKPEEFVYLTRIYYKAASNDIWAEHEIDYIFFVQKDVELEVNPNEIRAVKWVNAEQLQAMFDEQQKNKDQSITPWFHMICNKFFFDWWKQKDTILENKGLNDPEVSNKIHHLILDEE